MPKFNLDEHPEFRDALMAMAGNSREVADCERLLSQLEDFEENKLFGYSVRSNGEASAYCIGGELSEDNPLGVFAIVIEEDDRVLDARIYKSRGLNKRTWKSIHKGIIRDIEHKLGI